MLEEHSKDLTHSRGSRWGVVQGIQRVGSGGPTKHSQRALSHHAQYSYLPKAELEPR